MIYRYSYCIAALPRQKDGFYISRKKFEIINADKILLFDNTLYFKSQWRFLHKNYDKSKKYIIDRQGLSAKIILPHNY